MKKTLNINIGNSIIHIEEDAFELLTSYLIEVKQHFGKSADDFEIVSDIENRIAEMFTEILQTQQKQVIEVADVQVVIATMGSVRDFEEQSEEEADERPENIHSPFTERRIYRDTDEAMVAGVCSGLSHYLQLDVSVLRIIALFTVLLGGSGLIAYLILWISIPVAATRSEKMAMKGEAVNLQGFKRNFEKELSNLKGNFRNANDHLQPFMKHSKSFIAEFIEVLGRFMQGTGKTIFKIIAILIIIIGSLILLGTIILLAAVIGFWDTGATQVFPFSMIDGSYFTTFILALFIVIAIPLLSLILFSIRVAFNSYKSNKMVAYGLLLIWLCGLAVSIFYVAKTSNQFKEEAEFTQTIPLKSYPLYTLSIDRSKFFSKEDSLHYRLNTADYNGKIIQNDLDGPFTLPRNVSIRIEKSENSVPSLVESYGSQGVTFEVALDHAKNIQYDFLQQDSVLRFSPELHLKRNLNWRAQRIELVLKVPVGTRLRIDRDLQRYLQDNSLWDCDDENNKDGLYHGVMTTDGLTCQSAN
ncbi:PspC domain-containing protein [Pedobacter sp. L105]|uniref:PspC domain-containing protein n=1 Tax=Pedobacter sp. L105 TaxID=1641871 RepID=UPI00131E0C05|nr:PspC domain-containing protein [Pedobacter sp. L105]